MALMKLGGCGWHRPNSAGSPGWVRRWQSRLYRFPVTLAVPDFGLFSAREVVGKVSTIFA
jgi:hypothetical protein